MASQSTSVVKRQRSENWLEEDKMMLKELVREAVSIIENKNTDANTNAKKVAAWNNLRISFNNMARTPRTLQQIKAQWGIIKMSEKKKKCLERKRILQTGGGPPPVTDTPTGDDISVWLPHEFTVDSNEFDSDTLTLTDNKLNKQETPIFISLCENATQPEIQMMSQPGTFTNPEHNTPTINNSLMPQPGTSTNPEHNTPNNSLMSQATDTQQITTTSQEKQKNTSYKLKNKKIYNVSTSATQQIADTEIACRKELHEAQMANERQKLKNLLLKEEVLKSKLEYYKKRIN